MHLNNSGAAPALQAQQDVLISELSETDLDGAVELVTLSMSGNPVPQAVFGREDASGLQKQRLLFEKALTMTHTRVFAAKAGVQLLGIMCYVSSDHCQLRPMPLLRMLPRLWAVLGKSLWGVLRWQLNWKRHDHKRPHVHFGPLAVHPEHQGQGVGSALLECFCREMDRTGQTAYLETDKEMNLALYKRFGFAVVAEGSLLGVQNWFMLRPPVTNANQ
ncbi:hypothetical protein C7T94_05345 [Pedobacter yulinensis]|uniref:N-acetyltransferase domain-containing protein n=1 Tax=Pedobacter yulinensis TaxID=2126353 RepID=A0A2T3HNX5_9SPHI|nr:GNAT family N-acetyltransferase [Pedobacter yulinensis]PST84155.1 hypothetical protein C7T94_05345 [Pedobacter yulinensis]